MDKKFMGIIAGMLILCIITVVWASADLKTGKSASTAPANTYSAAYVDQVFDKNKVQEIKVTLSAADFEDMMQNPTREEYKKAAVTVNGQKVDNVGFRVKGNSSLSSVARSSSKRFSFKLDYDQYIDGQSLAGLTKLNLNNSFSDPSFMREYLSYSLLEEMDVPSPAYSYANLYINGELLGLYLAVEGIEEPFLARTYGNYYGNLYKPEGQGSDLVYTDDNRKSYSGITPVFDVKNGADEALLNMLKALNQGQELEKYLNVDEILRYFAINTVLVNMDSYQGSFKHNYYLYEQNGVFSILPWDYNMSFGGFGMGGGSNGSSASLYIDQPVSGTTLDQRPLLGKLLEIPEYKELYHRYIEEFINGPFSLEKMNAEIEKTARMIRPHLEKDPTKLSTMEQFEEAISAGAQTNNAKDQPSTNQIVPDEGERTVGNGQNQTPPVENNAAMRGRQPGGGMMSGNANMALVGFIRERIENVNKQLSGETPSAGNENEQSDNNGGMRGQPGNLQNRLTPPGGMQVPGAVREPNANTEKRGRADFNGGPGQRPDGAGDNAAAGGFQKLPARQLYLVGGALLLLLGASLFVFKSKTKYSV